MGIKEPPADSKISSKERTGTFTSTVVARKEGRDAALFFFSSRLHAGENLREVLRHRPGELDMPLQMCDALSRNMPDDLKTIVANCPAHARRNFVDVVNRIPEEVEYVLMALSSVYRVDAQARKKKLTRFLHVPGALLDNNVAERTLKRAILHRKNSFYYRSGRGALAGDIYMTLIHTCKMNGINPYEYLVALMRHGEDVESRPQDWLPWNYGRRLEALAKGSETKTAAPA